MTTPDDKHSVEKEIFTHDDIIHALISWLKFGEDELDKGHKGYFSGGGWAARVMRSHLDSLMSPRKMSAPLPECGARPTPVAFIGRRMTPTGTVDHETVKLGRSWLHELGYTAEEIVPLFERPVSTSGLNAEYKRGREDGFDAGLLKAAQKCEEGVEHIVENAKALKRWDTQADEARSRELGSMYVKELGWLLRSYIGDATVQSAIQPNKEKP